MQKFLQRYISVYLEGLLNSYSQVFFSKNHLFAVLLLFVSFFNIHAGISGMIAIGIGMLIASLFNFNKELIRDGSYTYNSVLVGLALGSFYEWNWSFFVLLAMASFLCFFTTVALMSLFSKRNLPYLSVPFLITLWTIILGSGSFYALVPATKGVYLFSDQFPELFHQTTEYITQFSAANFMLLYFRSLGAVFFQYSDLAGIIIAIGLLIYSRIAFVLSLIGFMIGYAFYFYFKGDFTNLVYSYVGFNFILTAIALGGFYIVASRRSFLFLLFSMPIIGLLISSFNHLLFYYNLPLYSLPFNIVVILTILVISARPAGGKLMLVPVQQYSPEKNHYKNYTASERFSGETYYHIGLPIIGSWTVSQGYDGEITHKDDWKYALDFDVRDEDNHTFRNPGYDLRDYYCYDLPVVAPASGWVMTVQDNIADNEPGKVNLENNWGNTIVIKHGEGLYSKLSHLKKDTFKVKAGDYVVKGDIVAYCGNSGRSPEPHLHFQLQATSFIGSKTLNYPLSYYLTKTNGHVKFHNFEVPREGELVSNIIPTRLLSEAFAFLPGKIIRFKVDENGEEYENKWEVFTNSYNQSYIYCHKTHAVAYFVNNGTVFYFTDFYGSKGSFLYYFYLSAYKIVLGYYDQLKIEDNMQADDFLNPALKAVHDIFAPFFHFYKAHFTLQFTYIDHIHHPSRIELETECDSTLLNTRTGKIKSRFIIEHNLISSITIEKGNKKIKATWIN